MDIKWVDYTPNNTECIINVYDDGNDIYKKYNNHWIITSTNNKGKVKLKNTQHDITINSISFWKVKIINN